MYRNSFRILLSTCLIAVLLIQFRCSSDSGSSGGKQKVVTLSGHIDLGDIQGVSPEDLTITLGEHQAEPDSSGEFDIQGNSNTPGLAMAFSEESDAILFNVIPNPGQGLSVTMNLHTTALSLIFMAPYVISTNPDDAAVTLTQIEALSEFNDFKDHLTQRMNLNAGALFDENEITDSLFTRVVSAYIMAYSPDVPENIEKARTLSDSNPVTIDPSYEKGGLKVTHVQGDNFKITNSLGRWAYAITPTQEFFVSPIGDLIDIFKGSWPFAPSESTFKLHVELGDDEQEVNVYGYGWHPDPENNWEDLDDEEQHWADIGGMMTIFAEFIPAALSVILNVRTQFRGSEELPADVINFMGEFTSNQEFTAKIGERVLAGDPLGVTWITLKAFVGKLSTDKEFQAKTAAFMGFTFSEAAVKTLIGYAALPIKVINSTDAVVAVAKTALGFRNGYFRTTFEIWREATDPDDFGNILGTVYDLDTNLPLEGATVTLQGDDNNPLGSSHQDVTNADGAYFFENITIGTKTITAAKQGYGGGSVSVNVEGRTTVTAPIIGISKGAGTVSGVVINDILERHNVNDGLFQGDLTLMTYQINARDQASYRTLNNGTYYISLSPGTYWIVAMHPDYSKDSVLVTITKDEHMEASKDLLLFPKCTMTGTIEYDMNNDKSYETKKEFNAFLTYASERIEDDFCGGYAIYRRPLIRVMSFTSMARQTISFYIDVSRIKIPDHYKLGAYHDVGCANATTDMGVWLLDNNVTCENAAIPINFMLLGDPAAKGCNCNIIDGGDVYLEEFGSNLTDVISGGIKDATLAGWRTCGCNGQDTDNDGQYDTWDVDCARARMDLEFRIIVGSEP
ncbi:carboxypeptidase regulatory-like domain-containing protein [bacterium]